MDEKPMWYPEGILFEKKEGVDERVRTFGVVPDSRLQPYIQAYWTMSWDLPQGLEHPSLVVPSFRVNLIIGNDGSRVTGVRNDVFHYTLTGKGLIVGALFTLGGFFSFYRKPVGGISDGVLSTVDAFNGRGGELAEKIATTQDGLRHCQILNDFFMIEHPAFEYPDFPLIKALTGFIVSNEDVTSTQQLVDHFDINDRQLQRLFDKYVGIGPKMLIRTKRFQTTIKLMMSGASIDWADLALRLGYCDQSHFINDFRKITGRSPADFKVANI